jgi:hypothetical protein
MIKVASDTESDGKASWLAGGKVTLAASREPAVTQKGLPRELGTLVCPAPR